MAKHELSPQKKESNRRRQAAFRERLRQDPEKYKAHREVQKRCENNPVYKARKLELEKQRMQDPQYREKRNKQKSEARKRLRATNPEWRDKDRKRQREKHHRKKADPLYLQRCRESQKRTREKKKAERQRLLAAMTPGQRVKFFANERKIRLEKKRERMVNAALAKQTEKINEIKASQQTKRTEKQRLEMEAHQIQKERLMIEADQLHKSKIDRTVAKIISDREKRAYRYRSLFKSYPQRVQEAIDYYYQLIEMDDAGAHSDRYFKGESIMRKVA